MVETASEHPADNVDRFHLVRRGVVLTPDPTNPYEAGGVLNPAAAVRDELTYVLYRSVALDPPIIHAS
jgi:hypothetical protein